MRIHHLMNVLLLMPKLKVINVFVLRVKFGNLGEFKIKKIREKQDYNQMNQEKLIVRHTERLILVTVVNHMYMYHQNQLNVQKICNVVYVWHQRRLVMITLVLNV